MEVVASCRVPTKTVATRVIGDVAVHANLEVMARINAGGVGPHAGDRQATSTSRPSGPSNTGGGLCSEGIRLRSLPLVRATCNAASPMLNRKRELELPSPRLTMRERPKETENMKPAMILSALVGATVLAGSAIAQQQVTGAGQFCIKGPTGPAKCEFQTMAQCEQQRPQNENDRCVPRAQAEATVGGPSPSNKRDPAPAPGEQKD
jgi:hypothetical protein